MVETVYEQKVMLTGAMIDYINELARTQNTTFSKPLWQMIRFHQLVNHLGLREDIGKLIDKKIGLGGCAGE